MTRAERVRAATQLRSEGLLHVEIAARLGISRTYVSALLSDPHGEMEKARKRSYGGVCRSCDSPTDGSNGPAAAPEYCFRCAPAAHAIWTEEVIIDRIQEWASTHDGMPPSATDWNPAAARTKGQEFSALEFEARPGHWPYAIYVQKVFGSWNAGIKAAGFTPRKVGGRGVGSVWQEAA